MIVLVVSDFHLGAGTFLADGQKNIHEDFHEDTRFFEFTNYYSSGLYAEEEVHLVLNGDIFNLITIPVDGSYNHFWDDTKSAQALEVIAKGHVKFFEALRVFASRPQKKVYFVPGNHDNGMDFPLVQKKFEELIKSPVKFGLSLEIQGVYIEHGHRYEAINTVPKEKYYITGPEGKKILNLPWGSLFCIHMLPKLKEYRPHLDKVRPLPSYIKWCAFHDTRFFLYMFFKVITYLITSLFSRYTNQNGNFKTTLKILKQVTIYPKYGAKIWGLLKRKGEKIKVVVMGHTHIAESRIYPSGQIYLNSGTWNPIPSVDAGMHESTSKRTYVYIKIIQGKGSKNPKYEAVINNWYGEWSPFREMTNLMGP
jgi:UDP-2,3-diacylglucosamine pyrophosphatase LpxH